MNRLLGAIAFSLCVAGAAQAASDPQLGKWTIDLARSKYVTGVLPKSSVATVTPYGKDGVTLTVNAVNAAGETIYIQYSAQYDGKPYPRIEAGAGAVQGQTVTLKRIDARTVERILYLGDKPGGTEHWAISKDGKTRTVTQSGFDLAGKPINNLQIYVK